MIRAGQSLCPTAAIAHHESAAAVATHVGEGPHNAIGAPHHQHGNGGVIIGEVITRVGNLARDAHNQWILTEEDRQFGFVGDLIGVDRRVIDVNLVSHWSAAGRQPFDDLASDFDLSFLAHNRYRTKTGRSAAERSAS